MSKGIKLLTSIISHDIPISFNWEAASKTILHIEPYVTTVISFPSLRISGTPNSTATLSRFSGKFSFNLYAFNGSITIPGSSERSNVLYIPEASTKFLGTKILIPLKLLIRVPMGEPECQIPSSLCPLVLIMTGAFWPPFVLYWSVDKSSESVCKAQ